MKGPHHQHPVEGLQHCCSQSERRKSLGHVLLEKAAQQLAVRQLCRHLNIIARLLPPLPIVHHPHEQGLNHLGQGNILVGIRNWNRNLHDLCSGQGSTGEEVGPGGVQNIENGCRSVLRSSSVHFRQHPVALQQHQQAVSLAVFALSKGHPGQVVAEDGEEDGGVELRLGVIGLLKGTGAV
ncbi:hypothetical protein TYRP_000807 [Tyrophagus putrescentiae]|nr:hypothetical protein TYRP_000807 [Tyrophagus putrescentiae]